MFSRRLRAHTRKIRTYLHRNGHAKTAAVAGAVAALAVPSIAFAANGGQGGAGMPNRDPAPQTTVEQPSVFSGRVVRRNVVAGHAVKFVAKSPATAVVSARVNERTAMIVRVRRAGSAHWRQIRRLGALSHKKVLVHWRPSGPGTFVARADITRGGRTTVKHLGRIFVFHAGGASWYGGGGSTACGQALNDHIMGVAHKTLPCGTKVVFMYHGRTAVGRVIDRGPYVAGREWDLTPALKRKLGFGDVGQVLATR